MLNKQAIKQTIKQKLKRMYDTGALHITLGTFATKFVALFGSIVVVRLLNKADKGVLDYVENIYSYAFIIAGFGLSYGVLRYLIINEDVFDKKRFFRYILRRTIVIDSLIAVGMIILSFFLRIPANFSDAKLLIPILALLLPFQDLLNEMLYTLRAFFKNKLYAYLAVGSSVILIGGRVAGALMYGVDGVLLSRLYLNLPMAILLILFVRRNMFPKDPVDGLSREEKKAVNRYSFQYMVTNGFWALFMLNDTFLLGEILNDPAVLADYKAAYLLPGNISIFATAIGVFVGPYFTKNEKNPDWVRRNFKKVYLLSAGVVGLVAGGIAVLAKPLVLILFGRDYLNVIGLMCVLLLAAFINSGLRFTTANVLASMGEVRYNMIVSGVGIALQFGLDVFLIPRLGVMAVAVSNCFVCLLMAAVLFAVFYKKYYAGKKKENA